MAEKYYKPILKDGDHLVHSSKNPDRVRGQSRDSDNKNPDIVEWEEVEIEEYSGPSREELEYELERLAYEERCAEQDRALTTLDAINSGLELFNNVLEFLNENPEVLAALISGGKKIRKVVTQRVRASAENVKAFFGGTKKTEAEAILEQKKTMRQGSDTDAITRDIAIQENILVESVGKDKDVEIEEMSIDEARSLIIDTLANYINMKKNIERLSRVRINEIDMPELDMNQVLAFMDTVIDRYPALMDERTAISVLDILNSNSNATENRRILEVLKIENRHNE